MQQHALQNAFVPTHIIIGAENKKSKKFDDNEPLQKIGGHYKINAISAYWDKKHIIGLQVYYKIGKGAIGDFLDAVHNKPEKIGNTHGALFEIGPDDYLLEINGRVSPKGKLNKIGFVSYRGKQASFGVDEGEFFAHKYDNYTFGGFIGGYRDYIDFLHISLLPTPQDFLREFKPIQLNLNMNNQPIVSAEIKRNNTGAPAYGVIGGNNNAGGGSGGQILQAKQDFMQINVPKMPMKFNTNPVPANTQNNNNYQQPYGQQTYQNQQQHQQQQYVPMPYNQAPPAYGQQPNFQQQQQQQQQQYGYPPQNNGYQNIINNSNSSSGNGQNAMFSSKYPTLKK